MIVGLVIIVSIAVLILILWIADRRAERAQPSSIELEIQLAEHRLQYLALRAMQEMLYEARRHLSGQ